MKKLLTLLTMASMLSFFVACDEEEEVFDAPTITATPNSIEAKEGETAEITLLVVADAGIKEITASDAAVTVGNYATGADAGSATVTATVTVSSSISSVTFTVTDQQDQTATSNAVSISTAADPAPSVSLVPSSSNGATVDITAGEEVSLTLTVAASDGIQSLTASVDQGTAGTLTNDFAAGATSGGAIYTYTATPDQVGQSVVHTFTVSDGNSAQDASVSVTTTVRAGQFNLNNSVDGVAEQGPAGAWDAATSTLTLTPSYEYVLTGTIYVNSGQTIKIEPGVVIRGSSGSSSMVIAAGGMIDAVGTADNPIIFTAGIDDLSDPSDLGPTDTGLWGGLVILGNAPNEESGSTTSVIEGIASAADDDRNVYGGDDPTDNSGTLQYVSIRHCGFELSPGNEINALSLGAVGSGTTIDHVEVYATSDDGIEFYGGTVSIQYAVMAFVQDDSFDWDQGYRGLENQFWFVIQHPNDADFVGELDGGIPDGATLYSNPVLFNLTAIGGGSESANSPAILMRDATAGTIANSIISEFTDKGIEIEDRATADGIDSHQRLLDGELLVQNNVWSNIGSASTVSDLLNLTGSGDDADGSVTAGILTNLTNTIFDAQISGVTYTNDGTLDPRPGADVTADLATPTTGIETTTYKGAFDPAGDLWINGWSALSTLGFTAN